MKKKTLLAFVVCLGLVTGCGSNETESDIDVAESPSVENASVELVVVEPEAVPETVTFETYIEDSAFDGLEIPDAYVPVLNSIHELLMLEDVSEAEGPIGIIEAAKYMQEGEALQKIGFVLEDLNGDELEELLIVEQDEENELTNSIYAIYTILEDEATLVVEGWNRSLYYLLEDNLIYHEGSGGAAYTIFGIYHLAEDGTALEVDEYYFSDYADEEQQDWGWFYNQTGDSDVTTSERVFADDEEAAMRTMDEMLSKKKELEVYLFVSYQTMEENVVEE